LGTNLQRAIEEQTKNLLGADLVLSSPEPFSSQQEDWFKQLGGEQAREVSLSTMVYFPRTESTRLIQARALSGSFPFYGGLETEPASASDTFRRSHGGALVEETVLRQFEAKVGDLIKLGELTTTIAGRLEKVPGETVVLPSIAPRVYLSMDDLPATGLLQTGSLARFRVYFKFRPDTDVPALLEHIRPQLDRLRLGHDTVAERKRELGRSLDNLYHFLNLVALVALLLGGVGVASAIHVHVKEKLSTVAVLRCLGGSLAQVFGVYLAQALALGLFGAVIGGAVGAAIQALVPKVVAGFLPFQFQFHTSWLAVARAMGVGLAISLLFALLPLLAVRRVSPLAALRISLEPPSWRKDPRRWLAGVCVAAGVLGFELLEARNLRIGLAFAGGLAVVFGVLAATAKGLVYLSRKVVPPSLPFVLRQGLANLHRPNNRTLLLLLSLGLGTFLLLTLFLVQTTLLKQLVSTSGRTQPNAVLFDVQTAQLSALRALLARLNLPVLDEAPIIAMRLTAVKGRSAESLLADKSRHARGWALRREYRSTSSDHLRDGEKLLRGHWVPQVAADTTVIPISLEEEIAKELQVGLNDDLDFDVQGVPVKTRVASIRAVEWRRIQPNFFVVFPLGPLDSAPAMHVVVTRTVSSDDSGRLQREAVKAFPNVSVIDLTLILQTIDGIVTKIAFVIRFMHLFTVLTGLFVMVSSLVAGRYQRIQESILLRTLGASRRQVLRILLVEYFSLGLLSALTGLLLATATAWALARFLFHTPFVLPPGPLLIALVTVPALTIVTGFLVSRGVLDHPPLAVLRAEA